MAGTLIARIGLLLNEIVDGGAIEELGRSGGEHVTHDPAPGAREPFVEGDAEALLSFQVELMRNEARSEGAPEELASVQSGLEASGNPSVGEFNDRRIDKWRPYLQRRQHACPIELDQHAVD